MENTAFSTNVTGKQRDGDEGEQAGQKKKDFNVLSVYWHACHTLQ